MNPMKAIHDGHEYFSAPLGALTTGHLELTAGAECMNLLLLPPESRSLVEALFEGRSPEVQVVDGLVRVDYRRRFRLFETRRVAAEIALHPAVSWSVAFRGGVSKVNADLSCLCTTRVDIEGGVSNLELALPKPSGTLRVRVAGGVSHAVIARPAGVPLKVSVRGGAARLHVDQLVLGAIGGPFEWETPGYETSTQRLELEVEGGVSDLTVQTLEEARSEPGTALVAS